MALSIGQLQTLCRDLFNLSGLRQYLQRNIYKAPTGYRHSLNSRNLRIRTVSTQLLRQNHFNLLPIVKKTVKHPNYSGRAWQR